MCLFSPAAAEHHPPSGEAVLGVGGIPSIRGCGKTGVSVIMGAVGGFEAFCSTFQYFKEDGRKRGDRDLKGSGNYWLISSQHHKVLVHGRSVLGSACRG